MTRRELMSYLGVFGFSLGGQARGQVPVVTTPSQPAQVQSTMPPAPPPVAPIRCPRCGREKYAAYILPLMKINREAKAEPGKVVVEPDPGRAVQWLECQECHTVFGAASRGNV